jgi:hypothetical protein
MWKKYMWRFYFSCLLLTLAAWVHVAAQQGGALINLSVKPSGEGAQIQWAIRQGFSTCFDVEIQQSIDGVNFEQLFLYGGICGGETEDIIYSWQYDHPPVNQWLYFRLAVSGNGETETVAYRQLQYGNSGYLLFPHPVVQGSMLLTDPSYSLPLTFQVFDLGGNEVVNQADLRVREIPLEGMLPNGLYFFRITDDAGKILSGRIQY